MIQTEDDNDAVTAWTERTGQREHALDENTSKKGTKRPLNNGEEADHALNSQETFETPIKEPSKARMNHADYKIHRKATDTTKDDTSVAASKKSLTLRVQLGFLDVFLDIQAKWQNTPSEVKQMIATQINVAPQLLQLSGPPKAMKPKFNWPLWTSEWEDGSEITCVKLERPSSFDIVDECDGCGDLRHLFYGHARQGPYAELEPVIQLCAECSKPMQAPISEPQTDLQTHDNKEIKQDGANATSSADVV